MNIHLTRPIILPLVLASALSSASAVADSLPDLTITDLRLNQNCQLVVDVKNLGPGALPETAFYAGTAPTLQMYRDNSPAGAVKLMKRSLQPSGGTYTHANAAANQMISGTYSFRAKIDRSNLVNEANENNNELTRTLSCSPPLPDLAITRVSFSKDCRARVTFENTGNEVYPHNLFNGVRVTRIIDGANKGYRVLADIDPAGSLKTPGGKVEWIDLPDFKATSTADYRLSGSGLAAEQNSANNQMTGTIPEEGCGANFKNLGTKQQLAPTSTQKIKKIEPKIKKRIK